MMRCRPAAAVVGHGDDGGRHVAIEWETRVDRGPVK